MERGRWFCRTCAFTTPARWGFSPPFCAPPLPSLIHSGLPFEKPRRSPRTGGGEERVGRGDGELRGSQSRWGAASGGGRVLRAAPARVSTVAGGAGAHGQGPSHSVCRTRALQIFQAPSPLSLRPLRPLRLKTPVPFPCAPRIPWFGNPPPCKRRDGYGIICGILSDGGLPLQRTEDLAQRNKKKAGAMNYAAPAKENERAAGETIRRSDGMTSRKVPAELAGRIDYADEAK